jgi:hypothetical protein
MFAIYPDGKSDGASGGPSSPFFNSLSFFGRMGLYFAAIRISYVFFGDRAEQQRSLTN